MRFSQLSVRSALAIAGLVASATSHATLVYAPYFNLDANANGNVTSGPSGAQTAFTGVLDAGYKTETFESFTNQTSVSPLSVFGNAASTLSGVGKISNEAFDILGSPTGRFNTTPNCNVAGDKCNWWETSGDFTVTFGGAFSAFGFYATDFGDFGASASLVLLNEDGSDAATLLIKDGVKDAGTGSLLFFGFTDNERKYYGVRFDLTQGGSSLDYIGIDDMILGNVSAVGGTIPEPASLALVALSLAGLAATRRKTKR